MQKPINGNNIRQTVVDRTGWRDKLTFLLRGNTMMKKEWIIEESDYGDELWFGGSGCGLIEVGGWVNGGCKERPEEWNELKREAHLISAAPDLLEALIDAEEIDDLHRLMSRIEQRRKNGTHGIAVSDDEDALAWRKAVDKAGALIRKRNAAIAKALGK